MRAPSRRSAIGLILSSLAAPAAGAADRSELEARYQDLKRRYERLARSGADMTSLGPTIADLERAVNARDLDRVASLMDSLEAQMQSLGLGVVAGTAPAARAHLGPAPAAGTGGSLPPPAGQGEYPVVVALRSSPTFLRLLAARGPQVGQDGAVGRNRSAFSDVAAQRDTIWLLLRGLATDNADDVDGSVRSLEYAFHFQTPLGNFSNARGASDVKAVGVDAFFLQAFGRMYLLIGQSPLHARFLPRLDALRPALTRALSWLSENTTELNRQDRLATNRLFFDALAFSLNGRILGDPQLRAIGDTFTHAGLANQRPDGTFNEHQGADTSYQAVSILNVAGLLAYSDDGRMRDRLADSLRRAVVWERARIGAEGEVSVQGNSRTGLGQEEFFGKPKDVNYAEVALAMLYASVLNSDPTLLSVGEGVARRVMARSGSL